MGSASAEGSQGVENGARSAETSNGVQATKTAETSPSAEQAGTTTAQKPASEINLELEAKLAPFGFTTEQRAVADKVAETGNYNLIPGSYSKETVNKIIQGAEVIKKFKSKNGVDSRQGERYNNEGTGSSCKFTYKNNPMNNPKAAKDIVVNPKAVYGFSPNPKSDRIGEYADYDWTDPILVELAKARREVYHTQNSNIENLVNTMKRRGASPEEIGRAVNELRNLNRLNDYINDPVGLEKVKQSNLKFYGNENGLTAEDALTKYGSWENVIENSMNSNPGMDACCGLYDKYNLGDNKN